MQHLLVDPLRVLGLDTPVFLRELRAIPWNMDAVQHHHRLLAAFTGISLLGWLIALLTSGETGALVVTQIFFAASLLALPALEITTLFAGLNSISGEKQGGQWDLMRLAMGVYLRERQFIVAKQRIVQLRTWRLLTGLIAMRGVVVVMVAAHLIMIYLRNRVDPRFYPSYTCGTLVFLILLSAIALTYLNDPVWRVQACSALAIAVSARTENITSAALIGSGVLIALWIGLAITLPVWCAGVVIWLMLYAGGGLERWALEQAHRSAFRDE